MVTWVLERNVFSERCFDEMVEHFRRSSIPYHVVTIIPFAHVVDGKVPSVSNPVVCYGSIGIQKLAKREGWDPGVWDSAEFDEQVLINQLGADYLNNDAKLLKLSEVEKYISDIGMNVFFLKPNTDTKQFAGEVLEADEFQEWYQNLLDIGYLEENDFEVVLSKPKHVGREWRLVMIEGQVAEYSLYRQMQIVKPEHSMPDEVKVFAERVAAKHSPVPVFIMDVVETDGGYKVVEYNTFNSAGLYQVDVATMIDKINHYVERM